MLKTETAESGASQLFMYNCIVGFRLSANLPMTGMDHAANIVHDAMSTDSAFSRYKGAHGLEDVSTAPAADLSDRSRLEKNVNSTSLFITIDRLF
jgi:hypothetical protein